MNRKKVLVIGPSLDMVSISKTSHSFETSYKRETTRHASLMPWLFFSSLSRNPSQPESSDDFESKDADSDMDSDKLMTPDEDTTSDTDMSENLSLGQTSDTRVSPSPVGNIKYDETDNSEENPYQPGPSKKPRNS